MKRDPFQILGIPSNATKRDIKKNHRLLSKKFHPDLNPDDPEAAGKFKDVQWAYETLCGENSTGASSGGPGGPTTSSAGWPEKPCMGYFAALRAYCERIKVPSRGKPRRKNNVSPSDREG